MILGHSELKKLIKKRNLISGLSKRDMESPVGCVFDLQLDRVYELDGSLFLGIEERETPDLREVAIFDKNKRSSFLFKPNVYYLVKTIEKVNMPENIAAMVLPRSTLLRSGIMLRTGMIDPGYQGELYFGLINHNTKHAEIELGARFAQIYFVEIKGKAVRTYHGQWQGGRATTKSSTTGREKQV
ncbi:MAG: 2'-deoxycytidine 5'-triphosphate deaminase [Patescibacteria group bacterium]|nr:2'-deoxycytidine 5'-triphosphate deaminase [Patescibacteria group bacterium]